MIDLHFNFISAPARSHLSLDLREIQKRVLRRLNESQCENGENCTVTGGGNGMEQQVGD